jgi:preprotein translocase subunit SecE
MEILKFFQEVRDELRRVVFPSKELVIKASIAVFLFTVFFSIYLWILDIIFVKIISFTISNS